MDFFLWICASLVAYIIGLVLLVQMTPRLLSRSFDDSMFMGVAALDIIGSLLAFGAVVATYALFSGAFGIKVLDVFLLIGLLLVSARLSYSSLQPRIIAGTFRASRLIAGSYSFFLTLAALYYLVELFIAH